MAGRGNMYGQNQRTGAHLYGQSAYANETLHAMPSSSQPPPEARGRSYGGGQSSFNPFTHEGQGRYINPYEQPPPPTSQTMQINQGSGFHSMGQGHHRRRAEPAETFEVVSTSYQPPASESGYGSYAPMEPQTYGSYGYDPSYGQTPPGEYQSSYGAPPAYSQGSEGYGYPAYGEPAKYQYQPVDAGGNNNHSSPCDYYYATRPPSASPMPEMDRPLSSGSSLHSRPMSSSSRSALGSAGAAMAMHSMPHETHTHVPKLQYSYEDPSRAYDNNAKPAPQLWGGTGNFGHSSTRISRPPGGHSQISFG